MGKRIIGNVSGTAGKTEKSETGGRKLAKQSRSGQRRRRRRRNKMKAVEGGGLGDGGGVGEDGEIEEDSRRESSQEPSREAEVVA